MARWKLMNSHYLNIPGIEWEYRETDRVTGKQARRVFPVPLLLDPADPTLQNRDGDVVVCDGTEPRPGDHIFVGEPTPEMEPLDDAARKITDSISHKWKHPIDTLPGTGGYSQSLIASFEKQIADALNNRPVQPASPASAIDPDAFAALQQQVAALMARNAELEQKQPEKPLRRA